MTAETPLAHYQRHPRMFLDIADVPDESRTMAHAWCLECDYDLELTEEEAEHWADEGVPWRTGTE